MSNFLFGVWQFFVVWQLGFFLVRRLHLDLPLGYRAALAFGLGEVVFSYTYFALGMVGGLRFWVLVPLHGIVFVALLPLTVGIFYNHASIVYPILKRNPLTSLVIAFVLLIYTLGACVPEREVDSLWYHLAVPLHYLTHGGFIQLVPFNMPSHYPMNVHLHFCLSLLIGNDTTVKVFILCHFIPVLILLWSVVNRYAAARWGLFAVAVYLCCLHFRLPVMANVQRAVYFYVFLSYALLWMFFETRNRNVFWIAAIFCGMAMGTKFNGILFGYVGQWLLILVWIIFFCHIKRTHAFMLWCGHTLIAWLMMSPWLMKSFVYTGNPLYPMLGGLVPTQEHFVPAMQSNANNHGLNILKSDTMGEFFGQIAVNINWLLYNADLIFFLGFVSLVLVTLIPHPNKRYPVLSGWIAYVLFTLLWGSDIARLFAVNYGVIVLLTAMNVKWIHEYPHVKPYMKTILYWLIVGGLLITFVREKYTYLSSPNIRWFGGVYLSEEARYEWLTEREIFTPELFRMKKWIAKNLDPEEELYGYRTGYLFYLDRKYIVSGAHFKPQVDKWLEQGLEYTRRQFEELGINYLLYAPTGKGVSTNPHPRVNEFLNGYCKLIHREDDLQLYRILPNP